MTIRQLQHFPQGLLYNIDHWHYLSRYADKLPDSQMCSQRDYVTDRAAKHRNIGVAGRRIDMPTQPFVQCGLEPLGILGQAVNEMLMQSYDGKVRVFPATPADWPAAFTLRAVGGFLVTSEREAGSAPAYVLIESLLGNECRVVNPWPGARVVVENVSADPRPAQEMKPDRGVVSFPTVRDAMYLLLPASAGTVFSAERNDKPKHYQEATLGKDRDF
jgi:hypothetical protein